jgi:prevent-host-death family protein
MPSDPAQKTLPLREANQGFARYVREVEAGAAYVITRNGVPVARLTPYEDVSGRLSPEQVAARARTRMRTAAGWPLHAGPLERDALHER